MEIIEPLEELRALLADPVQPTRTYLAWRCARAAALFASAADDAAMTRADWITQHDQRQQITREVQDQMTRLHRGGGPEPGRPRPSGL
ncbi:hypothetical protein ACFVH6_32575 [Spirillospora sp. NPDC127200]